MTKPFTNNTTTKINDKYNCAEENQKTFNFLDLSSKQMILLHTQILEGLYTGALYAFIL